MPWSQVSLGQMPRGGSLFAKLPWQWVNLRKWLAHQHAAHAAWGALGVAIPETGGCQGCRGRQVAQDRTSAQSLAQGKTRWKTGRFVNRRVVIERNPGQHEAIVPEALWERNQLSRQSSRQNAALQGTPSA